VTDDQKGMDLMRLGHLRTSAGIRAFAEADGRRIPVDGALPDAPATVDELVRSPVDWLSRLEQALLEQGEPIDGDTPALAPPLLRPSSIIAIGLNYADHCREFGTTPPNSPVVFTKAPQSVIADGDLISWPTSVTRSVDWEVELGVVIGRPTKDVPVAEALDAVFGYTVINDVTARDIQAAEQQWVRAKSIDTFCPMGPVIVPARDMPDPQSLRISSRLNGQVMQDSSTKEMIFSVAELISLLSESLTLVPGDVIATGTPLGVGAFRTPPVFLRDGDIIEVEIEKIGKLTNTCRERAATSDTKENA
jgi:2-keto-4-pentenoate hydratase/2-oxohepta-3-ene-1,7-dioic acid hydratase in catechol pathway